MGDVPETIQAPPTVNDTLVDEVFLRASLVERYTQGQIDQALAVLEARLYERIIVRVGAALPRIRSRGSRASARDLVERTKLSGRLRRNQKLAKRHLLNLMAHELRQFAKDEARWQLSVLQGAIPDAVELSFKRPAPALLREIATRHKFQGRRLADWVENLTKSALDAVEIQIDQGLVNGETIEQIVARLRGTRAAKYRDGVISTSKRAAERLVRTAVTHTQAQAREATFRENADIIERVKWVSTLDFRTSQTCMALDGQVFAIDEGPRPPAHPNCRSTVVGIVKSLADLGFGEFDAGTRASMDGQVPADVTYEKWLRAQPAAVQDEILGRGKGALFRRGVVPLKRWIDTKNRALTLAELERIENELRIAQGKKPFPGAKPKPKPAPKLAPKPWGEGKSLAERRWFEASFEGADRKVRNAISNAAGTKVQSRSSRAYYLRSKETIDMARHKRSAEEGKLTFRHEYGHRLDHYASQRKYPGSAAYESSEVSRAAKVLEARERHERALAANVAAGDQAMLHGTRKALKGADLADIDGTRKVAARHLRTVRGMSVEDFDRVFGDDYTGRLHSVRASVAMRAGRLDVIHAELVNAAELSNAEKLFISDFFEALTDAKIGTGHKLAYYRRTTNLSRNGALFTAGPKLNDNHTTEAFAEWFSFRSSPDPKHQSVARILRGVAPSLIDEFEDILDGLARSRARP